MSTLTETYNESKSYTNTIMTDISNLLDTRKIKYTSNTNKTEFIITSNKLDKNKIYRMIKKLNIPDKILKLLIKIDQVDDKIYIRQTTK